MSFSGGVDEGILSPFDETKEISLDKRLIGTSRKKFGDRGLEIATE